MILRKVESPSTEGRASHLRRLGSS